MPRALADSTGRARSGQPAAVVAAGQVRLSGEPVRVGPACAKPGTGAKRVSLVRDGGVVTGIEVICSCGERILLRCDYE
jgi:hypothetical protein